MERNHDRASAEPARAEVRVALEIGTPQIAGTVSARAAESQPFYGWLELVTLLEAARAPAAARSDNAR